MKHVTIKLDGARTVTMAYRDGTSDWAVIHQVWAKRCYDLRRFKQMKDVLQVLANLRSFNQRPLVIDAGANIGATALFFAESFADDKVVAIEPESSNFDLLQQNVGSRANIICVQGALSSCDGTLAVTDTGRHKTSFQTEALGRRPPGVTFLHEVPAFSVRTLVAQHHECAPFLIKIDIEGAEQEVFSSNTDWVNLFPVIIIELHDWLFPREARSLPFLRVISQHQRDFCQYGENIFSFKI